MLAMEDLALEWDGVVLTGDAILKATSGLDRALPSAYPMTFYWQVDFPLPERNKLEDARTTKAGFQGGLPAHELEFQDSEGRWNSAFSCRLRMAPGVAGALLDAGSAAEDPQYPRTFEFPAGRGSIKVKIFLESWIKGISRIW